MKKILIFLVAIATTSLMAKPIGLDISLGLGFNTNLVNIGDDVQNAAGVVGYINENGDALAAQMIAGGATAADLSSNDNQTPGVSSFDIDLLVRYDFGQFFAMPLFFRTGFGYAVGMGQEYSISQSMTAAGSTSVYTETYTVDADQLEIPFLIGFDIFKNEKSAVYFAFGGVFTSAGAEYTLSATQTGATIKDVVVTDSASSIGIMYVLGGKYQIMPNISIFGEIKIVSAAEAGAKRDQTFNDGTSTYAGNYFTEAVSGWSDDNGDGSISTSENLTSKSAVANQQEVDIYGIDMSYTRWSFGVTYSL